MMSALIERGANPDRDNVQDKANEPVTVAALPVRAHQEGIVSKGEQKDYKRRLAVSTCDREGSICAFNGSGDSSRPAVSAQGLTHPAVELLAEPPDTERVNAL